MQQKVCGGTDFAALIRRSVAVGRVLRAVGDLRRNLAFVV